MALQIEGNHLCKIFYSENGKVFTRRVCSIVVQRPDGRVERLLGTSLPDSIALYTGGQSDGKGLLEIIERPAESSPLPAPPAEELYVVRTRRRLFTERDGLFFVLGMLMTTVICLSIFSAWVEVHNLRH